MKLEETIDRLKDDVEYADLRDTVDDDCTICFIEDIETVLQELDRLQKENEEYSKQLDLDYVDKNFVSKDKIRELLEDYKKGVDCTYCNNTCSRYILCTNLQDLLKEE